VRRPRRLSASSRRGTFVARPILLGFCLLLAACSGVGLQAEGSEHDVDWAVVIPF